MAKLRNEDFDHGRHLIVQTMKVMRSTSQALLALFLASCSQEQLMEEITSKTIGSSGGEALSADGKVRLLFPSGALSQDTTITIRTSPGALAYASKVYDFQPEGQTFTKPVIVEFWRLSGENIALAQIKNGQKLVLASTRYDAAAGKASADLEHFSSYAAVTLYDPCAALVCGASCTWCDPADTSCVEPAFAKACDMQGQCVPAPTGVSCNNNPDAGEIDTGVPPDSGQVDGGLPDAGNNGAPEEVEQNDSAGTANPVGGSDFLFQPTTHGACTPSGDLDYFSFYVLPGDVVALTAITYTQLGNTGVCASGTDTVLRLYDSSGAMLAQNDDYGVGFCSRLEYVVGEGTYYVQVAPFVSSQRVASYFLDIALTPSMLPPDAGVRMDASMPPVPDAGNVTPDAGVLDSGVPTLGLLEVEPNQPQSSAQLTGATQGTTTAIEAAIMPAGDEDFFAFTIPAATTLTAHAVTYTTAGDTNACVNADTFLEIRDAMGTTLVQNDDRPLIFGCSEVSITLGEGDYVLYVRHFAMSVGTIALYYLNLDLF